MPHFTLTAALTGAIPPLVLKLCPHREHVAHHSFPELFLAIAVGQIITSVIMVPWFLNMLFGIPFTATVFVRLQTQLIQIPLFVMCIKLLARRLSFIAIG